MGFLNWAMLGGIGALLIPLTIHLLYRGRVRRIAWGAMQFLDLSPSESSRRLNWHSLLLLCVRLAIPILLAVALARPVLLGLRVAGAAGAQSFVLLIDNSASMLATDDSGTSYLELAKRVSSELVTAYPKAQFTIAVTTNAGWRPIAVTPGDAGHTLREIARISPVSASCKGILSIQRAIQAARQMQGPARHVVVVSDFQKADWPAAAKDAPSMPDLSSAGNTPVHLSLLQVGSGQQERSSPNLSISLPEQEGGLWYTNQPRPLRVTVVNHSEEPVKTKVEIEVDAVAATGDEEPITQRRNRRGALHSQPSMPVRLQRDVELQPRQSLPLSFELNFRQASEFVVHATIEDSRGLSFDDVAYRLLSVSSAVPVLLLHADDSPRSIRALEYLQAALAPYDFNPQQYRAPDGAAAGNRFKVAAKPLIELEQTDLSVWQTIVLIDPREISSQQESRLRSYLEAGGGIVVFAGPWRARRPSDTDPLAPILPFRFGKPAHGDSSLRLSDLLRTHLGLDNQPNSTNDVVERVQLRTWLPLEPFIMTPENSGKTTAPHPSSPLDAASREAASIDILLRNSAGKVLVARQSLGGGFVVQCGISCSDDWSNLPLRSSYVPLMQSFVELATGANVRPYNLMAGQPLPHQRLSESLQSDDLRVNLRESALHYRPNRRTAAISVNRPETAHLDIAGLYEALSADHSAVKWIAVSTPPDESALRQVNSSEFTQLAESLQASPMLSVQNFIEIDDQQRNGAEIWRWVIVGLIALLVGEAFLTSILDRRAL